MACSWPLRAQTNPAVHRFAVGAAEITVLSDGNMSLPLGFVLPGRERADVEALFTSQGRTLGEFVSPVNVTLVRIGAELILIDTGGGPDFMPTLGRLADNLEAAGIRPEAITTVVFTHAHPDHMWGVIDPLDGGTLFPKARHVMSTVERDFWLKPGVETAMPDALRGIALGSQRRLTAIAGRLDTVKPGAAVAPGITLIDTAGHTPGHVSVALRSGAEDLLIGGDALSHPIVSFAKPDWRWGPDLDQTKAAATRKQLLDRLVTDKAALLGYHLPWPGVGRVERKADGYRFIAS